jgi:hypothetical protein
MIFIIYLIYIYIKYRVERAKKDYNNIVNGESPEISARSRGTDSSFTTSASLMSPSIPYRSETLLSGTYNRQKDSKNYRSSGWEDLYRNNPASCGAVTIDYSPGRSMKGSSPQPIVIKKFYTEIATIVVEGVKKYGGSSNDASLVPYMTPMKIKSMLITYKLLDSHNICADDIAEIIDSGASASNEKGLFTSKTVPLTFAILMYDAIRFASGKVKNKSYNGLIPLSTTNLFTTKRSSIGAAGNTSSSERKELKPTSNFLKHLVSLNCDVDNIKKKLIDELKSQISSSSVDENEQIPEVTLQRLDNFDFILFLFIS